MIRERSIQRKRYILLNLSTADLKIISLKYRRQPIKIEECEQAGAEL